MTYWWQPEWWTQPFNVITFVVAVAIGGYLSYLIGPPIWQRGWRGAGFVAQRVALLVGALFVVGVTANAIAVVSIWLEWPDWTRIVSAIVQTAFLGAVLIWFHRQMRSRPKGSQEQLARARHVTHGLHLVPREYDEGE